MNQSLHSPSLANLFPDDANAQEFVNNLAFSNHLDQAIHNHGGHPHLSDLLRAKAKPTRILEAVHDLAEDNPEWAKNSQQLREMFPASKSTQASKT
jgi:hypothetical protein